MIYNFEGLSIQILTIDRIRHEDGIFDVRARPFSALSFRLDGEAVFEMEDKMLNANSGDVVFIPANRGYRVEYSSCEYIVVHLMSCNYCDAEVIGTENRSVIESCFLRMFEEWRDRRSVNKAKSYVYDVLDKLSLGNEKLMRDSEAARCVSFLEENFCDSDMSVERLCERAYVSRSSLQRYFKNHVGITPKKYLLDLRLNKALELLSRGGASVKTVAKSCGFTDEKYFSRAFKEKYGVSPSNIEKRSYT